MSKKTLTHFDFTIILQNHVFFNIFNKKTGAQQKNVFGFFLITAIMIL